MLHVLDEQPRPHNLKPWTHYLDPEHRRLFIIADINDVNVILMEVKEYAADESRLFNPLPIQKFIRMVEKGTKLKPYTPKV